MVVLLREALLPLYCYCARVALNFELLFNQRFSHNLFVLLKYILKIYVKISFVIIKIVIFFENCFFFLGA